MADINAMQKISERLDKRKRAGDKAIAALSFINAVSEIREDDLLINVEVAIPGHRDGQDKVSGYLRSAVLEMRHTIIERMHEMIAEDLAEMQKP